MPFFKRNVRLDCHTFWCVWCFSLLQL